MAARVFRPFELTRDILRTGQRLLNVRRVRNEPEHRAPQSQAALPLSAPRTSFNGTSTRRRQVALSAIGLADVKRLKNATGTTVNDVVLAVCTGALRRFLSTGTSSRTSHSWRWCPSRCTPTSTRPTGRTRSRRCSSSCPPTSTIRSTDSMAIREGTKGAKEEHNALGADMLVNWAEHATPNTFAAAARLYSRMRLADRHRPVANLIISNVPGPDFPLYLAGAEMVAGFPLGPVMDGLGVNITIMSYRGTLYWGIISCPETMPRVWQLAADIPAALDELLVAAGLAPGRVPVRQAAEAVGRRRRAVPLRPTSSGGSPGARSGRYRPRSWTVAPSRTPERPGAVGPRAGWKGRTVPRPVTTKAPSPGGPVTTSLGWSGARGRRSVPPVGRWAGAERLGRVGGQHRVDPVVGRVGHQQPATRPA